MAASSYDAIDNELPLYTRNDILVITQYIVFRRVE